MKSKKTSSFPARLLFSHTLAQTRGMQNEQKIMFCFPHLFLLALATLSFMELLLLPARAKQHGVNECFPCAGAHLIGYLGLPALTEPTASILLPVLLCFLSISDKQDEYACMRMVSV